MRFYKKYEPRHSRIQLGTGSAVPFVGDGEWGIYATNDSYIISELQKCIDEQRGGVVEISHGEYEELKKKEDETPSSPTWRETVGLRKLARMLQGVKNGAVAAGKKALPAAVRGFSEAAKITPPAGVSSYRPKARAI